MALEDFYEKMNIVERKVISDGMGGYEETWTDGVEFLGAVTTDNSIEMRLAEQQGLKSIFTITLDKNIPIRYLDVIKRKRDGEVFKITSRPDDMETPSISDMNFKQMSAERWTI